MTKRVLPAYAEPGVVHRLDTLGPVHFVGIGGAGMSGIARIMAARGVAVSGSDAKESAVLDSLRRLGIRCQVGHDAAHLADAQTLVVSSAIRPTNPELQEAQRRGLLVLPRAAALASVMQGQRAIAVAGTHGKTSTTSMLVVAATDAGADPSYAIGGDLHRSGANSHHGSGDVFVAEADESDGSFLLFAPYGAIVTNVEADHLDNYGDFATVLAAFEEFVGTVRDGGFVILCHDDEHALALRPAAGARVISYGRDPGADLVLRDITVTAAGTTYRAVGLGLDAEVRLQVPGEHMALNSAAALAAGLALGLPADGLLAGLAAYTGVGRRMDFRGEAGGVRVYDDYAHHPTEVRAQLTAARAVAADGRLIVCFQPHLYSRTKAFAAQFADALGLADELVVMDVYAAREDPDPEVTSALIADAVTGIPVHYVERWADTAATLAGVARPGDLVMTVGAGDVTTVAGELLELLGQDGAAR